MNIPPNDNAKETQALINMATDITEMLDTIAAIKGEGYASALNTLFNIQTGFSVCTGLLGTPTTEREEQALLMVFKLGKVTVQHAAKAFVCCLIPAWPPTAFLDEQEDCVSKRNKLFGEILEDMELLFKKHDQYVPVPSTDGDPL